MIKVKIIADSFNERTKDRLTTFMLTYPRYIHAELMTHRVFSRNAASSRAIPVAKFRQDVTTNPVIPSHWGTNRSGMQAGVELDDTTASMEHWTLVAIDPAFKAMCELGGVDVANQQAKAEPVTPREYARRLWLQGRDMMLYLHEQLEKVGLHKQIANRIIEPWFHIEVLVSATEYQNWFGLRCHKDAHPDIQVLADAMLELYVTRAPAPIQPGDWHLPFGDLDLPADMSIDDKIKICVARAARVSYKNFDGTSDVDADKVLHDRLAHAGHWSPFEHVAQAMNVGYHSGNFRGFHQYRKSFPNENRVVDLKALWEARKRERNLETLLP